MPRYNVIAEFTLSTEIECDLGYHSFDSSGVEEFSDESYFSTQSVEADGGQLRFVVEADSEEDAQLKAAEVVFEGQEVEDGNGLTWAIYSLNVEAEEIEIPMDLDRATTLVEAYLAQMEGMDDDLKEAFGFLMDTVTDQALRAVELASTITELRSEIRRLSEPTAEATTV